MDRYQVHSKIATSGNYKLYGNGYLVPGNVSMTIFSHIIVLELSSIICSSFRVPVSIGNQMNNTVVPDIMICDQTCNSINVASRMPILSSNKFNVSRALHTR